MIHYIQIFYTYILPIMALLSFGYIIYLLIFKKSTFEYIEKKFDKAIEKNSKLSEYVIMDHFDQMQKRTAEVLEHINYEVQANLDGSVHLVRKLQEQLEQIVNNQKAFNSKLSELERSNAELHNEIKKRDAIIEHKNKQLGRLKGKK